MQVEVHRETRAADVVDQIGKIRDPGFRAGTCRAREQPALRALLDAAAASSLPLRGSQRDEQRMIEAHTTERVRPPDRPADGRAERWVVTVTRWAAPTRRAKMRATLGRRAQEPVRSARP